VTPLQAGEIRQMERAGRMAGELLKYMGPFCKAGTTTNELDRIAFDWIKSNEALPAPLGYHGFPKSICTSVNDCICHGVPSDVPLKDGDIINVDVTVIKDGFYGDTSATFFVGEVSELAQKLTDCAREAMLRGIEEIRPFATTGDIGFAITKYTSKKGFYPVKEIGGHGIGKIFHDDPFVPSYGKKGRGPKLRPWCCITVEPMVNATKAPLKEISIPGSTIKYYLTGDGSLSAQFEHTVMITDKGYEILTLVD
jgi:methionyl aminopeptidase